MESSTDEKHHSKPVAGYPTGPRYPPSCHGYAPPWPGYPAAPGSCYYSTPPPPPPHGGTFPPYYASKNHYYQPPPPLMPEQYTTATSFHRLMFYLMIIIVALTSGMAFVTWLMFATEIPNFTVDSLLVPTFEISNSTLNATFQINVTITKSNYRIEFSVDRTESVVLYRDNRIAKMVVNQKFELEGNKRTGFFEGKLESDNKFEEGKELTVQDLEKDRENGMVFVYLRDGYGCNLQVWLIVEKANCKRFL
ncbi:hypothetical protein Acr_15g0011420 [Actinidia rufa]|uniref:Late embryogenesis abundant (LEA) hydroxyproline-rich glycoprotein family n=1 Tax=Actinidia rufa TaxID=165716 RepID=A0A7J0FVD1_9ERIC|nr:hypothetical protein Acr_15g0011420 [Actinidia rufa]